MICEVYLHAVHLDLQILWGQANLEGPAYEDKCKLNKIILKCIIRVSLSETVFCI